MFCRAGRFSGSVFADAELFDGVFMKVSISDLTFQAVRAACSVIDDATDGYTKLSVGCCGDQLAGVFDRVIRKALFALSSDKDTPAHIDFVDAPDPAIFSGHALGYAFAVVECRGGCGKSVTTLSRSVWKLDALHAQFSGFCAACLPVSHDELLMTMTEQLAIKLRSGGG